jgi:methylthioribose-1-phosphate isomerase
MNFKTIEYKNGRVIILDQKKLPSVCEYIECVNYKDVANAISDMVIRGAPAIGVAGAFACALLGEETFNSDTIKFKENFLAGCDYIQKARPTAVNLTWAVARMKKLFLNLMAENDLSKIKKYLIEEAIKICTEDIEINKKIGEYGKNLIKDNDTVLTYCNAGSLATAGFGTALGVIRAAFFSGKKINVFSCETRPYLQGARLTTWELIQDNIPVTLITDNMAGYFMGQRRINCVITGADRIASNGDAANKIGTYSIAILANFHKIPFYIAAPFSTIDSNCSDGSKIPIEERDRKEVTHISNIQIAPDNVNVLNPSFDVVPNNLISGIVTEKGVYSKPYKF